MYIDKMHGEDTESRAKNVLTLEIDFFCHKFKKPSCC